MFAVEDDSHVGENVSQTLSPLSPTFMQFNQPAFSVYNIIVRGLMSLFASVANMGTIIAISSDASMRSRPSNLILLSLAVADFGTGAVLLPILTTQNGLQRWPLGGVHGCRLFLFIEATFLTSGIFHIVLLTWDRYRLLTQSYSVYITKQTHKVVLTAVTLTWMLSIIPGTLEMVTWNSNVAAILKDGIRINYNVMCVPPSTRRLNMALSFNLLFRLLPLLVILILGVCIVVRLCQHIRRWNRVNQHQGSSTDRNNNFDEVNARMPRFGHSDNNVDNVILRRRYIKPIIVYIILLLLLVLCTFPVAAYAVIINSFCRTCFGKQYILYWVNLMYFNSCVNPVAVIITNRRVWLFYQRCIHTMCCNCISLH